MTSEELLQSCLIHIKTQIDDRYSLAPVDMDSLKVLVNYIENESIPKEKIKEIIYPTPENYVPIEVQTSDIYSKLQELLEKRTAYISSKQKNMRWWKG